MSAAAALAFKIPSEPGWRVVNLVRGEEVADRPGFHHCQLVIKPIAFWGMCEFGRDGSELGGVIFGGGPAFTPLDGNGCTFEDVRRIVSPLETLSDAELIAEVTAKVEARDERNRRMKEKPHGSL